MDEEFFVLIFLISAIAGFLLFVKMIIDYRREAKGLTRGSAGRGADRSLGASELRALLQEAVAEGVAPLEERVERMERALRRLERPASPQLPPRGAHALLDDASDLADAPAPSGREDRLV